MTTTEKKVAYEKLKMESYIAQQEGRLVGQILNLGTYKKPIIYRVSEQALYSSMETYQYTITAQIVFGELRMHPDFGMEITVSEEFLRGLMKGLEIGG